MRPGPEADRLQDVSAVRARRTQASVHQALDSPGRPLDVAGARVAGPFGFDLSRVRIHDGAEAADSAAQLGADAYTAGPHIVFGHGQYDPHSAEGQALLAHELTHVEQQGAVDLGSNSAALTEEDRWEARAQKSESALLRNSSAVPQSRVDMRTVGPGTIQRKVAMRDVGRGEQSGFARVPELIARLNAVSTGLTFALTGTDLSYTVKPGGTLSNFDTQMQGFIDQGAVIPLRFTNRHGLLGTRATGFNEGVVEDAWSSGYVDIDDLLASNDLGLQEVLVHFLRERTATPQYAHRIGSESLETDPAASAHATEHQREFDRAHAQGIQAELAVLRGFFSDPSIRLIDHDSGGDVFRVYRNSRGDTIRTRRRAGRAANTGVDAITVEVVTRDGRVHTPEEYKALIAAGTTASTTVTSGGFFSRSSSGDAATLPP